MMRHVLVLISAVIGIVAASPTMAEPRDSVDRGARMDTDALRDDVGTNRLKVPSHPLVLAPIPQPGPTAKGKTKKTSASSGTYR